LNQSRLPPHDLDAERAVLGACLIANEACIAAIETLQPGDFYAPQHAAVFDAIRILTLAEERVEPIVIASMLPDGLDTALPWLLDMLNASPSVSNTRRYASTVLEHSKSRSLIMIGSQLVDSGYNGEPAADVARVFSEQLSESELLRRHADARIKGFYEDMATLDTGEDRGEAQPWIAEGLLRRGQRLLIAAKAGLGKSTLLRQLAFCAENGVHPWTGQRTEKPRRALVVELEAGDWDITASMRSILFGLKRSCDVASVFDLSRPALLHRPGGLDIRSSEGMAALEAAIQRVSPELVVIGPVKYMSIIRPGENYETAALALHGVLNTLSSRYRFALAMEAHFSRGDHGAPGGSERWVDWPDVGFSIHPPEEDVTTRVVVGGTGTEITVKQFRIPRDADIWLPSKLIRGADRRLPWSVDDQPDPYKWSATMFETRFGGYNGETHEQGAAF